MFYNYIKGRFDKGAIRVGIPAYRYVDPHGTPGMPPCEKPSFAATGFSRLAVLFLNPSEKTKLVEAARDQAVEKEFES